MPRESRLVTCIVPVFNGERYLVEALDSILAQTYRPLELVVVDDGSTDATPRVAAGYGRSIRYLWQDNAGPAAARNRGLHEARGELVAFLDADDLWDPGKLARQMASFRARPQLDLCITHVRNFCVPELARDDERRHDPRFRRPWRGYSCTTLLARRRAFDAIGPFDERLRMGEDLDWFARARERGALLELLPDVLVYRRLHPWNTTLRRSEEIPDSLLQVVHASLRRRRAANLSSSARR